MVLSSLADIDSTHLAILLQNLGHICPDQHLATSTLYHRNDVVGNLTAATHWIVSTTSHEMSVQCSLELKNFSKQNYLELFYLHGKSSLRRRTAIVSPAVHEHGLKILVVSDFSDNL